MFVEVVLHTQQKCERVVNLVLFKMDEKTNVTILAPHFLHSLNLKLEPLIEF